jgi:hypothetical protein
MHMHHAYGTCNFTEGAVSCELRSCQCLHIPMAMKRAPVAMAAQRPPSPWMADKNIQKATRTNTLFAIESSAITLRYTRHTHGIK